MARLEFCDYHNMIAILEKYEHNVDFHPIVDFVEGSYIRYALIINPTVYVSYIHQFWSTARVDTSDEETKILATVDGKPRTISESSIRRNLKLRDEAGISSLPDAELFENHTLMGYNISPNQKISFQKGQFSHQLMYLNHTIMQCLSPKSTCFNEFSSNIATALVCLATNRVYNFSKMIFDGMVRNVNNKVSKFLMYPKFISKCLKMSQFGPITHSHTYTVPFHTRKFFTTLRVNSPSFSRQTVPLFESMLVTMGEGSGTPTKPHHTPSPKAPQSPQHDHSSSIHPPVTTETIPTVIPTKTIPTVIPSDIRPLRQYTRRARIAQSSAISTATDKPASPLGDDSQGEACLTVSGLEAEQDMANILKTSTFPYDSTPRVTSLAADEGSMQQQLTELTDLYTPLQRQQIDMASKIAAQDLEITSLKARIKLLEDKDGGVSDPSGVMMIETRMQETRRNWIRKMRLGASILTSGVQVSIPPAAKVATVSIPPAAEIPTGSGVVPTGSPIFTTATVATPYSRRKGKGKMVESETLKKKKLQKQMDVQMARQLEDEMVRDAQRMNEQIARDAEIARIYAEEELQMLIDSLDRNNETIAKYLHEYEQFAVDLSIGEKIELISDLEEGESLKRKGIRLEQESAKKAKTSEEVSEEDLKTMMQLVPIEEVYVEALQASSPGKAFHSKNMIAEGASSLGEDCWE
uniref:Synaptobrevin, longin-like domain protein n=1 Tax=Tanacetum cinerariifolium TaxID=118510 RepID=A0A6L2JLH4_TANCI|nr:hypothetical protein [Tanacetum cinerariifolium]